MTGGPPDPKLWRALSPQLDALLDLPAADRLARLQALRMEDPAAAEALSGWLADIDGLDKQGFLQAPAVQVAPSLAGQTVGAYTLLRELGSGGMGSVWLAQRADGRFESQVAIKFLSSGLFSAAGAERFAREGRIMARLSHPNIARLLDAGHLPLNGLPQPYLVLEYVHGEPIHDHCAKRGLGVAACLRLFLDVLDAVVHAHNRLILHRDLKPSNILVTDAGEVKLLDFGIAKLLDTAQTGDLTQQAAAAFTPQCAAPEQLQGGEVTTATDVYALGVLLFRLLSGQLPLQGAADSTLQQWQAVLQQTPPLLSSAVLRAGGADAPRRARLLRGDLDTIVARALKKAPAERYANAADMADDLRRHLAHEPIAARPDTWAYRSGKFVRRHRLPLAAGLLVSLALTATTAVAWQQAQQARHQQAQAEGLIEFMLGDLPAKLKPVGRLDALDNVGAKALAYYAAQTPGSLDADSLGRRARALHLIGEINEQSGRLDEAAARFAEAAASTAELLARQPDDAQRVFDHAQSQFWVGMTARRLGQRDKAEAAIRAYQQLSEQLLRLEPGNPQWQIEAAHGLQNMGVLHLDAGRAGPALQALDRALGLWRGVLPARPAMAIEMANTWGWVSKAHEALNNPAAAVSAQQAKFQALAQVPQAARDREAQYLAAVAHVDIGRLQLAQGQADAADASWRLAENQLRTLVDLDPANLDWQAQLGSVMASLAELHLGQAQGAQALSALQRIMATLLATPKPKVRWWLVLQGRLLALRVRAEAPGAVAALQAWSAQVQGFESQGKVLDAAQAQAVAAAALVLGDALRGAGQDKGAVQVWQQALQRLGSSAAQSDGPGALLHARLSWRLGASQDVQASADILASIPYRHPDVQVFHEEKSRASLPAR